MQSFYDAWQIVQQFIAANAEVPKEVALHRPPDRQVARFLAQRRDFPVLDVVEALRPLSQPGLLKPQTRLVGMASGASVGTLVAPRALLDGVPYEPPTAREPSHGSDTMATKQHTDWYTLAPRSSSPPIRLGPVTSAGRVAIESSDGDLMNLFVSSCQFGNMDKIIGGIVDVSLMASDVFYAEAGKVVTVRVENMGTTERRVRVVQGA